MSDDTLAHPITTTAQDFKNVLSVTTKPAPTSAAMLRVMGPPIERDASAPGAKTPKDILEQKNELGPKLVIFMVGLPARGKSYICKKLVRYLSWSGFNTRVFNVGNRRRVMASGPSNSPSREASEAKISLPDAANANPPSSSSSSTREGHPLRHSHPEVNVTPPNDGPDERGETPPPSTASPNEAADANTPPPATNGPVPTHSPSTSPFPHLHAPIPKSLKPSSIAQLLRSKFHGYNGPVPEPCPSPIVPAPVGSTTHDAKFFDPDNPEAKAVREKLALDTLEEIFDWLKTGGGKVAIHDATNSTIKRRRALLDRAKREKGVKAMFIESICTDKRVLEENIRMKLEGPDYKNMPPQEAMRDFLARTAYYERAYETIDEEAEDRGDLGFIKLVNVGKTIIAHNVHGYLESQCVFYLMQMHIRPRTIWLTRHGESEYNVNGRIGGDPPLTPYGQRYADALARFLKSFHPPESDLQPPTPSDSGTPMSTSPATSDATAAADRHMTRFPSAQLDDNFGTDRRSTLSIWTSTLRRTVETVAYFDDADYDLKRIKFLNEIYAGLYEDMTYAEIEDAFPEEYYARQKNKLIYRYPGPGGESYVDVIERLRPIIIELERMQTNVLIVTHQVILRTLLSYFVGVPLDEMPTLSVPLHTLYCLRPKPYGADLVKYRYNLETDWFDEVGNTL
ncbi:6-phosphofructo-2-kinase 1 [Phlyctochytrium arcticum]|nr:6-phosphofructo-2-kinase 1 [Phlyctochytrium arcticum]